MNSKSLFVSVLALTLSGSAHAAFINIVDGDDRSDNLNFQVTAGGVGPNQGYVNGDDAPIAAGLPELDPPAVNQFGEAGEEEFFTQFTTGFTTPTGYTVIDENDYEIEFPEDGDLEEIGVLTDQVWQNDLDGTLVFASRVTLFPEIDGDTGLFEYEGEFNELRRDYGSFTTDAGWFAQSTIDRTFDSVNKSGGLVTFVNDMSGEEGNPYSVWHLVATNATSYTTIEGALTLFSEEDPDEGRFQDFIFGGDLQSFTPVPVPAALPLMASALFGLGFLSRKRG